MISTCSSSSKRTAHSRRELSGKQLSFATSIQEDLTLEEIKINGRGVIQPPWILRNDWAFVFVLEVDPELVDEASLDPDGV